MKISTFFQPPAILPCLTSRPELQQGAFLLFAIYFLSLGLVSVSQ